MAYPVFSFGPDPRFVFFDSLKNETDPQLVSLYQMGQTYLSQVPSFKNQKGEDKFQLALDVLQQGIQVERANEREYTQNLIERIQNPNLRQAIQKRFDKIFPNQPNSPFDYNAFINLLNEVLDGKHAYQQILNFENKRLQQLKKIYKELPSKEIIKNLPSFATKEEKAKRNQERAKRKKEKGIEDQEISRTITYAQDQMQQYIHDTYLTKHTLSGTPLSDAFSKVIPTIDNLIAREISSAAEQIFTKKETIAKIEELYPKESATFEKIRNFILTELIVIAKPKIKQIITKYTIDNTEISQKVTDNIVNQFEKKLEQIADHQDSPSYYLNKPIPKKVSGGSPFYTDKEGHLKVSGEQLARQLIEANDLLSETANARNSTNNELLDEILKATIGTKNENFRKLNDYQDPTIQQLLNFLKNGEDTTPTGSQPLTPDELQKLKSEALRLISRKAAEILRNKIPEAIQNKSIIALEAKVQEMLKCLQIRINGPVASEVIDVYLQRQFFITLWQGGDNKKADSISIIVGMDPTVIHHLVTRLLLKDDDSLSAQFAPAIAQGAFSVTAQNFVELYTAKLRVKDETIVDTASEFSLAKGYEAWKKSFKQAIEQTEAMDDKIKPADFGSLAAALQNSIVVTNTVKTFNDYNNDLGFVAGSMGANVTKQVENMAELFNKAGVGMTGAEKMWLEVAIVNMSKEAIGQGNRDIVERYLSALASFAIFDEGSFEVEQISRTLAGKEMLSSPKIMHLYRLNGLYFPGSYVLQRVYERLTVTIAQTQNTVNNDGVHIVAMASPSLIDSRLIGEDRWKDVYQKALDKDVSHIAVTFISDLLNITAQLKEAAKL